MSDEPQQQSGDPGNGNRTPRDLSAGAGAPAGQAAAPEGKKGGTGRPRRTGWRRAVPTWRAALATLLVIALILIGGFIAGYQLVGIPPANPTATAQSNVYLYKDGTVIARDGDVNRQNVQLAQVPLPVQHAVLAAEDRNFYSERAVDIKAMFRAGWNTLTGKGRQGGSTITQQFVKNYYLGQEQTVIRKIKEFFIAIKLNREVSKDHIFEGYLNTSYFGRNAYGIQAAAQAYYGKDIGDITTAEGAYLASLLNAPSAYDVVVHPENKAAAVARWHYVLDGMVKENWLSASERATMQFPVPDKVKRSTGLSGQRGYIVQAVKDYLTTHQIIDEKTLATGGYRITTTLEKKKQNALVEAVDDNVMSQTSDDRTADRNVRVGGASIDPTNGRVVAMYGGIDYTKQYVNNATRRDYQVGSTFKPFVFTSAVANGSRTQDGRRITPNTVYDGTNRRMVQGPNGPTGYAPANEDDVSYGPITVRMATDKSVNAVYAQMAEDVGPDIVKQTAIDLGIPKNTPDLTASPSIALGTATASVLDMTGAYATLANHGRRTAYTLVDKVSKDGQDLTLPDRSTEQAVSREAADTTTAILQSVVENGSGTAAQGAGRPAAGKTGTAEEDKAAWFAGYTPDLATVIAVMGQDPDTGVQEPLYGALGLSRVNGGGAPAQTWAQYTGAALQGTSVQSFDLTLERGAEEPYLPTDEATEPTDTDTPFAPPPDTQPSSPANPPNPPTDIEPAIPPDTPTGPPDSEFTDGGDNGDFDDFFPRGVGGARRDPASTPVPNPLPAPNRP
ncbi:transglycosylase domain-containing protein [Streptomyces sp. NRRL B-24720]|uniref:transglycosylase domain-containing protein n=1 Tax=Streptomyces sp. NRRL B-24720 TaxID=1476876 RepID=UPI0006908610|nr:transglycosylase domain-containing protein [Streptomyces sp. NRRL B-24720]